MDTLSSATPPPPPPPPRAAPELPDEIVEDIFLRVPPVDSALLLRAALACKRWARLFAGRGFRRRYRELHAAAPMLGVRANLTHTGGVARFIPTPGGGGFRPVRDGRRGYRAHDARHGRVLLNRVPGTAAPPGQDPGSTLAVWDPITDELHQLPLLLLPQTKHRQILNWNAAVLCGAAGACDHLDCRPGPFRVALVGIDVSKHPSKTVFAHVYSSETGAWGEETRAALPVPGDELDAALPGVLARNALHFVLVTGTRILKLDLATRQLSVIHILRRPDYGPRIALTAMDDGELGFAEVCLRSMVVRIWSRGLGPEGGNANVGPWVLIRDIELRKELPADALLAGSMPIVVAFAEGGGGVFVKTIDGLYSLDVRSGRATKFPMTSGFLDIIPYVSFYTPVLRAALAA